MTTKRQLRSANIKEKKIKKSTKIFYLSLVLGGGFVLLVIIFLVLFNALFPTDNMEARKKDKQIIIYFSDQQERFLRPEIRYVFKENDTAAQAIEVVKALLEGSKKKEMVNTFPAGVVLRDIKVDDAGVAFVNFSKSLIKKYDKSGSTTEMATIYSLTNSITQNIPSIKKVKILVEGKELPSIKGHISTQKAFNPDLELLIPEKEKNS